MWLKDSAVIVLSIASITMQINMLQNRKQWKYNLHEKQIQVVEYKECQILVFLTCKQHYRNALSKMLTTASTLCMVRNASKYIMCKDILIMICRPMSLLMFSFKRDNHQCHVNLFSLLCLHCCLVEIMSREYIDKSCLLAQNNLAICYTIIFK